MSVIGYIGAIDLQLVLDAVRYLRDRQQKQRVAIEDIARVCEAEKGTGRRAQLSHVLRKARESKHLSFKAGHGWSVPTAKEKRDAYVPGTNAAKKRSNE